MASALQRLRQWIGQALYGAPRKPGHPASARRPRLSRFLALAGLPYVAGAAAFVLIVGIVDPYDLRPWGLTPHVADHLYPDTEWPLLIKAVSAGDYRTVLVGASTVMGVSSGEMRQAFGADTKPVNLSTPMATPEDMRDTLKWVETMPRLQHVVLVVDHAQIGPLGVVFGPARMRRSVLASTWAHAGDFSTTAAEGSVNRLLHGVYDRPEWAALSHPTFLSGVSIVNDRRGMARLRRALALHRSDVLGKAQTPDCARYPFLGQVLEPALRRLLARGVKVDLLFPPYPLYAYYDWIDRRFVNDVFAPGPVYPQLMALKTCTLLTAAKFGDRVAVTAMDNDLSITAIPDNYADAIHLLRPAAYQAMMDHVAKGDSRLTLANLGAYDQALRRNISDFQLAPSNAPGPAPAAVR